MSMDRSTLLPGPSVSAAMNAVFVKGLGKGTTERCMTGLFGPYGSLVDCQIARHRSGRSAGFAIISFASHEEAQKALTATDGSVFLGRKLSVRWYNSEQDGPLAHHKAAVAALASSPLKAASGPEHEAAVRGGPPPPPSPAGRAMPPRAVSDKSLLMRAASNSLSAAASGDHSALPKAGSPTAENTSMTPLLPAMDQHVHLQGHCLDQHVEQQQASLLQALMENLQQQQGMNLMLDPIATGLSNSSAMSMSSAGLQPFLTLSNDDMAATVGSHWGAGAAGVGLKRMAATVGGVPLEVHSEHPNHLMDASVPLRGAMAAEWSTNVQSWLMGNKQEHIPLVSMAGMSEPGAPPSLLSLRRSLEDEVAALARRSTLPHLDSSRSSSAHSLEDLRISSDESLELAGNTSNRLMNKWSPSSFSSHRGSGALPSSGASFPPSHQRRPLDPIGTRTAPASAGGIRAGRSTNGSSGDIHAHADIKLIQPSHNQQHQISPTAVAPPLSSRNASFGIQKSSSSGLWQQQHYKAGVSPPKPPAPTTAPQPLMSFGSQWSNGTLESGFGGNSDGLVTSAGCFSMLPQHQQQCGSQNFLRPLGMEGPHTGGGHLPPCGFQQLQSSFINDALEQYALALAQLNSAQSQMMAASALLQTSGLMLPPPTQQQMLMTSMPGQQQHQQALSAQGGMRMMSSMPGAGPTAPNHSLHGGVTARRELF